MDTIRLRDSNHEDRFAFREIRPAGSSERVGNRRERKRTERKRKAKVMRTRL